MVFLGMQNEPISGAGESAMDRALRLAEERAKAMAQGTAASSSVNAAFNRTNGGLNFSADEPQVVRGRPKTETFLGHPMDPSYTRTSVNRAPLSSYEAEYWEKVNDPEFVNWIQKRAYVMGAGDLLTSDGVFNTSAGFDYWRWLGASVASSPAYRDSMSPEQYANMKYQRLSGDALWEQRRQEMQEQVPNPIQTDRVVSSYEPNPDVVKAKVDDLAMNLLGRMAQGPELERYRKQITAFVRDNPSITTTRIDATDPDNIQRTVSTRAGASPEDAVNVLEQKMRRGSEGMAFNAGQLIEQAMSMMDRGVT